MQCPRPIGLVLVTLSLAYAMPTEMTTTTSTRSTPTFGDTLKKLTNQLLATNTTTLDMVSDARTPPKVKQQVKLKEEMENSHAGVAIPVPEDVEMDETTKKMNFYKLEKPTTNSGLSTWILLSGQAASTTKPPTTKTPTSIIKPISENNVTTTVTDKPDRVIKPIFKRRTSTPKPTTTTTTTESTKLTKIKASLLNNAVQRKNITTKKTTSTTTPTSLVTNTNITSTALPVEAKDGEVDLVNNADGKKKKTSTKRRKNKPKRRKPADKNNTTTILKPNKNIKQNAVSTQLYNYLAREIMPTVGVGLVGLMVTAGLASYFLYPFGAARRSDDIDRKDKGGQGYYYSDNYSGGIPEEEAIGKVIAGMPSNTLFSNNYKSPTSRDSYKLTDRKAQIRPQYYGDVIQGSVENIPMTTKQNNYQSNSFEPIVYSSDDISRYSSSIDKQFVVGSVPKETVEEATPAVVPEHGPRHLGVEENVAIEEPTYLFNGIPVNSSEVRRDEYGPRSLKIRKKRSGIPNDIENEINTLFTSDDFSTIDYTTEIEREATTMAPTTTEKITTTTLGTPTTTTGGLPEKVSSFIDMMKELIQFKAKLGLQVIQNITEGVSRYISRVQTRLDQQFRNGTRS